MHQEGRDFQGPCSQDIKSCALVFISGQIPWKRLPAPS